MFYRLFMFFTWIFIIVVCFLFSFGRCIFDKSPEEYDTWDKDPIDYNINSGSSSVKDTTLNKQENENKNKENLSPEKASANADIDIYSYDGGYTMGFEDGKKGREFGTSIKDLDHDAEFEEGYEDGYYEGRVLRTQKERRI